MSRQQLNEAGFDMLMLYQFLKRLTTPFNKTKAYQMGLIDDKGNSLKPRKDLTSKEKKDYTRFDVMVFNLKKLINKLPGGESKIKNFAVALLLLKEEIDDGTVDLIDVSLLAEEMDTTDKKIKSYNQFVVEDGMGSASVGASSDTSKMSYASGTFNMDQMMPQPGKKKSNVECSEFGKCKVFHVSDDTFNKVQKIKGRYDKFISTIGQGPVRDAIADYAKTNPSKSIMLKNKTYGNYTMLKLGSKEKW